MKKFVLLFIFFASILTSFSQEIPREMYPPSWKVKNLDKPTAFKLPVFDLEALKAEDAVNDLNGAIPWRFGYELPVNHNFMTHGEWTTLKNGDKIWRIPYKSKDALSLNFVFTEFYLPEGTKLYVYNDARDDLIRPFSHHNNNPEEVLGTWMVKGEKAWIEYHQPAHVTEQAKLTVGSVVHGYRTAEMYQAFDLNDAEDCHYDVDCDISPVPDPFDLNLRKEEVKRATALQLMVTSTCSGTLINNTSNDGTPYILTANHCGGSVNESLWSFRFNWRSPNPSCGTTTPSTNGTFQTVSGATLRAASSFSDMRLVEAIDTNFFNNNPDLVWAGWNNSKVTVPPITFGIHHPAGDIQKVTRYDLIAQRTAADFNGNPNTEVWFFSDFGIGFAEPGASGSALYNEEGHIIGMLSGGNASCSGTTSNATAIIYGRFDEAWDFGDSNSNRLKEWLDPGNTGLEVLGIFPPLIVYDNDAAAAIGDNDNELCGTDFTPQVTLINRGLLTLNSADVSYFLDSDTPTVVNWTGTLAQNDIEILATPVYSNLSPGPHTFTVSTSNPNGVPDEDTTNDTFVFNFNVSESFETQDIIFDITTDDYGVETTWEVYNISSSPDVLIASGPSSPYGNNTSFQETITLPALDNCYRFVINDSFGDGICCDYGNGSYTVTDDNGNVIISGGDFGDSESVDFKAVTSLSVVDNTLENSIRIYPNPVDNRLNILSSLRTSENLNYVVYNILGQELNNGELSPNNLQSIDMSQLSDGNYFIKITSGSSSFTKKIIKR